MSLNILKRTRVEAVPATDPITYEEWSEWSITNDAPPYTDTLLVQYKTEDDASFKENYLLNLSDVMSAATADGTPYKEAIAFIESAFDEDSLTPYERASLKSQTMANIAVSTTNSSMQMAFSITDKDAKFTDELAVVDANRRIRESEATIASGTVQYKIDLSLEQLNATVASKNNTIEKTTQLIEGVKFNNKIESLKAINALYGQHKLGGGTITSSMWSLPFAVVDQLLNGTVSSIVTANIITSE